MILQTGGFALGATSTKSNPASAARSNALFIGTIPTCSPSFPINLTSFDLISSLI